MHNFGGITKSIMVSLKKAYLYSYCIIFRPFAEVEGRRLENGLVTILFCPSHHPSLIKMHVLTFGLPLRDFFCMLPPTNQLYQFIDRKNQNYQMILHATWSHTPFLVLYFLKTFFHLTILCFKSTGHFDFNCCSKTMRNSF